jgi:hypothetical protein
VGEGGSFRQRFVPECRFKGKKRRFLESHSTMHWSCRHSQVLFIYR